MQRFLRGGEGLGVLEGPVREGRDGQGVADGAAAAAAVDGEAVEGEWHCAWVLSPGGGCAGLWL